MSVQEANSVVNDYKLKQKKLVAEFSITGNATPASKTHGVPDLPGVMVLRTEGKTADADAIEDLSGDFTAPSDDTAGDSTFGFIIKGGSDGLGDIRKVLSFTVAEKTATATGLTLTRLGTYGLTDEGNIAGEIVAAGCDLDTESPTIVVTLEYLSE
jgi:hypothetical protein